MTGTGGAAGTGGMAGTGGSAATGGSAGAGGAARSLDADCHDPTDNSTALFQCVRYNGETRCLNPCVQNQDCRHGRVCLTKCTPATQDADCPGSKTCAPNGQCYARPLLVPCTKNDDCASGMCDLTDMKSTNYMKCLTATGELLTPDACNAQRSCLPGETCIDGQCEIQSLCADGPPLAADQCFPQLTSYQINVNAGFLVTGTQAGSYAAGKSGPNGCEPVDRDPRLQSRIPLRPYPGQDLKDILCGETPKDVFPTWQTATDSADGFHIDSFDPARKLTDADGDGKLDLSPKGARQEAPQLVDWMKAWTKDVSAPNACLYLGGPTASETYDPDPAKRMEHQHVRARFRNTQVAFVLADIDRAPPAASTLHFDVHGGFRQASVVNLTTVQVSAPARLVLGPIDSTGITWFRRRRRRSSLSWISAGWAQGRGRSDARSDRARESFRPRSQRLSAGLRGLHGQPRPLPHPVMGLLSQTLAR